MPRIVSMFPPSWQTNSDRAAPSPTPEMSWRTVRHWICHRRGGTWKFEWICSSKFEWICLSYDVFVCLSNSLCDQRWEHRGGGDAFGLVGRVGPGFQSCGLNAHQRAHKLGTKVEQCSAEGGNLMSEKNISKSKLCQKIYNKWLVQNWRKKHDLNI